MKKYGYIGMLLRKTIGWLAELTPDTCYYSSSFGRSFQWTIEDGVEDDPHKTHARTCLLGITIACSRNNMKVGGYLTATHIGVTDRGRDVGDFVVTVERTR